MEKSHFLRALRELELNSSPGYPLMLRAPSNRAFFKVGDDMEFDQQAVDYVWEVLQSRIVNRLEADPIRLFIKAEPHKIKKLEKNRFRLISSVALVDQIIDHMLFDNMNDAMVKNWPTLPSKVGWSVMKGGWRAIPKTGKWIATDKSSWDWTVNIWYMDLCLEIRQALCRTKGPKLELWSELAAYRYRQLYFNPLFITSGGLLLRQKNSGVQKSGCVNTITDNSLMQWILHARVCLEMGVEVAQIYAMGDDVLQEWFPRFTEYLETVGQFCKIKDAQLATEFAGLRFSKESIEPLYKGKHAFVLLHLDEEVEQDVAIAYSIFYHRSKERDSMRRLFELMGLKNYSLDIIDLIYDGDERSLPSWNPQASG